MKHFANQVRLTSPKAALVLLSSYLLVGAVGLHAQERRGGEPPAFLSSTLRDDARAQTEKGRAEAAATMKVPAGTILPVVLRSSFSFDKCKAGQTLHGKIAQDVPLPNGARIRKGATIDGRIVRATPLVNGTGARTTLQFDRVNVDGLSVPVTTNLRAIAGFMTVLEARTPDEAPAEGSPYNWLPRTQIGGDSVYGVGGPVMSSEDTSKVIGKSVEDGVLAQVSAKSGTPCRGALDGNDSPQALWVFSSDACGVYGIDHLKIEHAGRTEPKGTIVLLADTQKLALKSGDGLLLRTE